LFRQQARLQITSSSPEFPDNAYLPTAATRPLAGLAPVVTSILFGAYHWWTGIGNIIEAVLIGILLMLFYRRSAALWPVVLGHYVTDIVDFAL
jgi:membrane protease YdiL (CAAX protease family)